MSAARVDERKSNARKSAKLQHPVSAKAWRKAVGGPLEPEAVSEELSLVRRCS